MNVRKFALITGGLLLLAIVFMVMRSVLTKDEIQPKLQTIISTTGSIQEQAEEASQKASTFELQTSAASLFVTSSSDNVQLKKLYKDRYRKDIKSGKSPEAEELRNTQPGDSFDSKYKTIVRGDLEENLASLKTIYNQSQNQKLKDVIKVVFENQTAALEKLK